MGQIMSICCPSYSNLKHSVLQKYKYFSGTNYIIQTPDGMQADRRCTDSQRGTEAVNQDKSVVHATKSDLFSSFSSWWCSVTLNID